MEKNKQKSTQWKVEGDYFEACNCDSVCPCIFLADSDQGDCQLTTAWHIEKGHFGQVVLNGLNVIGIFHAPGNMVKGPKWQAAVYLDARANKEQAEALGKIFSGQVGGFPQVVAGFLGEVLGVKNAKIEFEIDGKKRRVHIPEILDIKGEALTGADSKKESVVTNPAMYAAPGFDPVISHSTAYTYHDYKLDWDNSGKNAFYSNFSYAP